jgi:ACS family hexuronate transporter-like MFS transporter
MPRRWLVVAMLFGMALINFLDRQTLSVLAPVLQQEIGLDATGYSRVVAAFLISYSLGMVIVGFGLDRFGVRRYLGAAVACWSLAAIAHALSGGWRSLALFRAWLGLAESAAGPSGVKAVGEWVPRRERGLAMAVFSSGNLVGAVVAPPLVAFLGLQFGWRATFVLTGLLGFVWLAVWWRWYRQPEQHPGLDAAERALILDDRAQAAAAASTASWWRDRRCWALVTARLITDSVPHFFAFWIPTWLAREHGVGLAGIGLLAWIPFLAADLGSLGGGFASDRLVRAGSPSLAARLRVMRLAACAMPLTCAAAVAGGPLAAVLLLAPAMAAQSCWMANQLALVPELAPTGRSGAVASAGTFAGTLAAAASMLCVGPVVDRWGFTPVLMAIGCLHLIAFAILSLMLPRRSDT